MRYSGMLQRNVLVLLVACCGCGSGNGADVTAFVGVYATTLHSKAQMPGGRVSCSDPGTPVAGAAPFFRLGVDPLSTDPGQLRITNCTDAGAMICTPTLVTLRAGGPGLEDDSANSQTGGGTVCQLYFTHAEATLTGSTIEIEVLDKFDAPTIAAVDCTLQRAQELASSSDCQTVERWKGTRP